MPSPGGQGLRDGTAGTVSGASEQIRSERRSPSRYAVTRGDIKQQVRRQSVTARSSTLRRIRLDKEEVALAGWQVSGMVGNPAARGSGGVGRV
ncbi:MAG: hypothetical protein ACR2NT_08315 [Acidimicrobiia bacterium]